MSSTKSTASHTVTRIILHIPRPFDAVLAKVHSSLSTKSRNGLAILDQVSSKTQFETATNEHLGPHGFLHFATIEHSEWLQLYDLHQGKKLTRIVYGNPQVASTMLQHDVRAGLFAPVEALLVDLGDEGTEIIYVQPSGLIVGAGENPKLKEAAERLDKKLETFWDWVAQA